jgi:anti-anti-sigma factor
MRPLKISIDPVPDHSRAYIVRFDGDFDGYAQEKLIEIQKFFQQAKQNITVILDFSKLNYLNSYAIGHLVAWRNHMINLQGRLFIVSVNDQIKTSLDAVGGNLLFNFLSDVNAAIQAI